jgi:hypothetical protein
MRLAGFGAAPETRDGVLGPERQPFGQRQRLGLGVTMKIGERTPGGQTDAQRKLFRRARH